MKKVVLILAIVFLLAACSRSEMIGELANAPEEQITSNPNYDGLPSMPGYCDNVNVPVVQYLQFKVADPNYVAAQKGFFAEHGICVEFAGDVIAGPNAIQAVASGKVQGGLSSVPALINANSAGLPIVGVVDVQTTMDDQALQRWYVQKDSPYEKLSDLEAGTIYAVNIWRSSFHYTSLLGLEDAGIPEEDIDFRLLSFADQIPALMAGEVEVAGLIPPYQGYLADQCGDDCRELWNDYDLYGRRHVSLIFLNRIWAEENPDIAEAYVGAIVDAINYWEENQEEAAEILAEYTSVPAGVIGEYHYTENGRVYEEDIQAWLDWLIARGDAEAWVVASDVGTNVYNEAVRE